MHCKNLNGHNFFFAFHSVLCPQKCNCLTMLYKNEHTLFCNFWFLTKPFWDAVRQNRIRGACYPLEIFVACLRSSMYMFRTIEVLIVDRFHKTCIHFQVSLCPYLKTFIITKVNNNSMIIDDWIGFLKGETHKEKRR